jgi:hypothetical protein
MGVIQLERLLGCPAEHLEFHVWYLIEKNWVLRQNNGQLGITVAGIDQMIEDNVLLLRRDRMIAATSTSEAPTDSRATLLDRNGTGRDPLLYHRKSEEELTRTRE